MQGFNFQHEDKRDRRKTGPFGVSQNMIASSERDNHRPLRTPPHTESEVANRALGAEEVARSTEENEEIYQCALALKQAHKLKQQEAARERRKALRAAHKAAKRQSSAA